MKRARVKRIVKIAINAGGLFVILAVIAALGMGKLVVEQLGVDAVLSRGPIPTAIPTVGLIPLPYFVVTVCEPAIMRGIAEIYASQGWQVGLPYVQIEPGGTSVPVERNELGELAPCGFTALSPSQRGAAPR